MGLYDDVPSGTRKLQQFGDGSWGQYDTKTGEFFTLNGAPLNPSALGIAGPSVAQDNTAQVDGAGVPYIVRNGRGYDLNGQPYNPVALPVNQHPGSSYSSNTSTSQSYQDPRALALDAQRIENERANAQAMRDQSALNGDRAAAQYWQTRLDTLGENAAARQFTSGENAANRASSTADSAANRTFQGAESAAQRGFNASESAASRAFTAGESALSRAQRAGEFAADYGLRKVAAERQQLADRMAAAETYSRLSGSADLTGYDRFQQAGGGVLGNSIAAGAVSLTPEGQLGSARALEAARAQPGVIPDYNPYAVSAPGVVGTQPAGGAAGGGGAVGAAGTPAGGGQVWTDPKTGGSYTYTDPAQLARIQASLQYAGTPYANGQSLGSAQQIVNGRVMDYTPGNPSRVDVGAAKPNVVSPTATQQQGGYQWNPTGTGGIQRFALGTMRPPVREPVTAMPTGAGIDTLTGRYAEGTFISGDSTDPMDPAAGGAHPEQITLDDPPGADNARAEVEPLTPPGVGDTDTGGGAIGALLIAIGNFLNAQGGGDPVSGPPTPLGGMGGSPRFALGTGIQPEDQPYIDEVMAMRLGTKYSINPYAADFQFQSPTRRAIDASAFQTATGVPGSEVAFEADKYAPGGLARNSRYAQELQMSI